MAAHGLRQRALETGVYVLGVEKADRQATGQGIEERLDRRRPPQGGSQQPDLARGLPRHQRGIGKHLGQFQACRALGLGQQGFQARPHGHRRIAHQLFQLAEQTPFPTRVML
ncbi:hypothetical protein D3C84_984560 [compost metagenome]